MDKPIDDGGPAFPAETFDVGGMSLRDWFAGQALAGICADPNAGGSNKAIAVTAYSLADAMLEARKAGTK